MQDSFAINHTGAPCTIVFYIGEIARLWSELPKSGSSSHETAGTVSLLFSLSLSLSLPESASVAIITITRAYPTRVKIDTWLITRGELYDVGSRSESPRAMRQE